MRQMLGLPLPSNASPEARDKLLKGWWGKKLADESLQVEAGRRRNLIVERLIKKTQDGTLGKLANDPWPEESDMRVASDDTTIHYHLPAEPAPPLPARSGIGTLAKVGLGGALLAGGVGLGAVIPLAWSHLTRPAATAGGDTNTDTAYIVDIGKEPIDP